MALTVTIVRQSFENGTNGVANTLDVEIQKEGPGQKVAQMSINQNAGFVGIINDSMIFLEKPTIPVTCQFNADTEFSPNNLNVIVQGGEFQQPIRIRISLLFRTAQDIRSFPGFQCSEQLKNQRSPFEMKQSQRQFDVTERYTIREPKDQAMHLTPAGGILPAAGRAPVSSMPKHIVGHRAQTKARTSSSMEVDLDNQIQLKVITPSSQHLPINVDKSNTVLQLKQTIAQQITQLNVPDLAPFATPTSQRLIFQGQILTPDAKVLKDFPNLTNGKAIHMVKKPATDSTTRQAQTTPYDRPGDNLQRRAQSSQASTRLTNCRVLQRNFNECVNAAQMGTDPDQRPRHNTPGEAITEEPTLTNLGHFTKSLSESLLTWSMQLNRLGQQLVKDEALPDRSSAEYQDHRRLIQNNMDAARYLAPELQNFSHFIVPLGENRPRTLDVVRANHSAPRPQGNPAPS